ncbi:MAG: SulP family inorganic anion transporter [Bacteriovoracia bacterium]
MKQTLKYDLIAGLSVFLVAIPLCLGIALACGAPLISGLVAGIIGGIVIGTLSDSHLSVSGPAAGLVAIVLTGISDLGSYQAFVAAVFLAGILQMIMALMKAGRFANLLPHSVIEGMLAAIGIILIIKQYPVLLGRSSEIPFHGWVLGLGLFSLLLLFLWDKFFIIRMKLVPGSLVVVVLGTLIALAFSSGTLDSSYFVQIPAISSFSQLKEVLVFPDWSAFGNLMLYKTAIVLALVASIESLLCVNAIERMDPLERPTNKNRELLAQGAGNAFSGLVGGLPVTSVIIRSSVNLNAGAKTKTSAIFHGFLILAVIFFGSALMNLVPLVSLAAVLMYTGYKLAHPRNFIKAWKTSRIDFVAFLTTVVIVVQVDLLIGVLSGIAIYYLLPPIQKHLVTRRLQLSPVRIKTPDRKE